MASTLGYQFNSVIANPIEKDMRVATITERDNIPNSKRWQGMTCFVTSEETLYILKTGVTNTDWAETLSEGIPVKKAYADATALYAAQSEQEKGFLYRIEDSTGYLGAIGDRMWLEYLGTASGDETDYHIVSQTSLVPYLFDWTADLSNYANKTLIIGHDFDLGGGTVTLPSSVVLDFKGGSFSNGTIIWNNTVIKAEIEAIFSSTLTHSGLTKTRKVHPDWFGAKGDGLDGSATANAQAFKDAISFLLINNGGVIEVPEGHYKIDEHIALKDNMSLIGHGYNSWIQNISQLPYLRCVVITGNLGSLNENGGMFNETRYDINAVEKGSNEVTFVTAAETSNFSVGDTIGVFSNEDWAVDALIFPKYTNINQVIEVDGDTIKLRYKVADDFSAAIGNPTIVKVSGRAFGYPSYTGVTEWIANDCVIKDLRLTQSVGISSWWYCIFVYGLNHLIENIVMDDCSTMIGSNALGYSTIRNIKGRFDGGAIDTADLQISNLIENIEATRVGKRGNVLGFSTNNGSDITVRDVEINFAHIASGVLDKGGYPSLYKVHRGTFDNFKSINAETQGLLIGFGDDCSVRNSTITNPDGYGVLSGGAPRFRVENNIVTGQTDKGIYAQAASDEYIVSGNIIGIEGSRGVNDVVEQSGGFSTNAVIRDNITYVTTTPTESAFLSADYTQVSSLTAVVFESYNILSYTGAKAFKVYASGFRSGLNDIKTVQLVLDNAGTPQIIADAIYTAPDTSSWVIEATIVMDTSVGQTRTSGYSIIGGVVDSQNLSIANTYSSGVVLDIQGFVANASDAIIITHFKVEPIFV